MSNNRNLTGVVWRKASYSNGYGGDCVEVAGLPHGRRAVRDSKNPTGPALIISPAQWAMFTVWVRR